MYNNKRYRRNKKKKPPTILTEEEIKWAAIMKEIAFVRKILPISDVMIDGQKMKIEEYDAKIKKNNINKSQS